MGSSQSSPAKTSKGGGWTGTIYFDPHADKSSGDKYTNTCFELERMFEALTETDEHILNVMIYKVPLSDWQLTMGLFYHAYVVYETENWWWSIEQNTEGLTVQRSKTDQAVRDRYRQGLRNESPVLIIEDWGKRTMQDVAGFLYSEDFLNNPYSWTHNNCKHFAKAFFDEVGKLHNFTVGP